MAGSSGGEYVGFLVYILIFVAVFFILSGTVMKNISEPVLGIFSKLGITVRQLILSGIINVKLSTASLGTTSDNVVYLLVRQAGFGTSSPYVKKCFANDSQTAEKCIVEISTDCWDSYGEGQTDTLIGQKLGYSNQFLNDNEYYDFSIDCGVVVFDADTNEKITVTAIDNYYKTANVTAGNKTEAEGRVFTYADTLGFSDITNFVDFNADRFPTTGVESGNKLIIKIKYVDIPNKLTNVAGWCGADAWLSDIYGAVSGGKIEFPCWNYAVTDCVCPNGDCSLYPSDDSSAYFLDNSHQVGGSNDHIVVCVDDFSTYSLVLGNVGDSCSADASCIEGLKCNGESKCAAASDVMPPDSNCNSNAGCGVGYICRKASSGAATTCLQCVTSGSTYCESASDCCLSTNACSGNTCKACVGNLGACTSDDECCSGLKCSTLGCFDSSKVVEQSDWGCDSDNPCEYGHSCHYHAGGGFGQDHLCE